MSSATSYLKREEIVTFVQRLLSEMELDLQRTHFLHFESDQHNPEESAYQTRLSNLIKQAFLEIYRTPALAGYLDTDNYTGRDLLGMFDGSIMDPLAAYAQYQELQEEIQCPEQFTGHLTPLHSRREQLFAAQNRLRALNQEEMGRLVEKLLRGADVEASVRVQQSFLAIYELAVPLTQGPLVTHAMIRLEGGGFERENLFQRACQEAIAEIAAQ